jgi:hypothetical protein
MNALRGLVAVFAVIALVGQPFVALAATAEVVGVLPMAELDDAGTKTTLVVGTDVQIGQTVVTGPVGQVELIFSDGTKLVVGPSSSLLIEDYLLRTDGSAGKLAVSMLSGTFRFFTGTMPKSSYELTTPSGTIGIRGTIIEVFVNYAGNALIALLEGAIDLCAANVDGCTPVEIDVNDTCAASFLALNATGFDNLDQEAFATAFPYLISQEPLQEPFHVDNATMCFEQLLKSATNAIPEPRPASANQ